MAHKRRAALLAGAALLTVALGGSLTITPPPPYCEARAFRDYEVIIGRAASLRPAPGCTRPSLVRRVSRSGEVREIIPVPLPTPNHPLLHVWLFLDRLEYTLDGKTWHPLRLL